MLYDETNSLHASSMCIINAVISIVSFQHILLVTTLINFEKKRDKLSP